MAETYARYPASSIFLYNGTTILHYLLGAAGMVVGYDYLSTGYPMAVIYFTLAMLQMYVLMPMVVCPNCVYYRMNKGLCISGLNVFSRKIAKQGNLEDFPDRGKGIFCHNHMYMAALILPVPALLAALFFNFSLLLLGLFLGVVVLLLYRIFVLFPKIACIHCGAKRECPNAQSMGLNN